MLACTWHGLLTTAAALSCDRTWERFRCTAGVSGTGPSCALDPDNCISEALVRQHADILATPEWHDLGYVRPPPLLNLLSGLALWAKELTLHTLS